MPRTFQFRAVYELIYTWPDIFTTSEIYYWVSVPGWLVFTNITLFCSHSRLSRTQSVLLTHGDSVERVGENLKIGGWSTNRIVTAIYNEVLRIYGVQFHPEVDLTINGKQMLSNFLYEICELTPNFTMGSRKEECIRYIREKVGNNKVLVSLEILLVSKV